MALWYGNSNVTISISPGCSASLPGKGVMAVPQSFLDAFHHEIATRKLSFFRGRSRLGRGLPRFRDQQASLLSGSIAFRAASTPIPALNLLFSSIPARTRHASHSSYVPGQPQRSNPGTYQACFPLFLRARPAKAFQAQEDENSCSDKTNHRLLTKPVVCSGNGDSSKCLVMVRVSKKYASGYSITSPVLALVIRLISGSKR